MFTCERCGSSYSATHVVSMDHCPRCRGRDRIAAPLTVKPLQRELGRRGRRHAPAEGEPVPPGSMPPAAG